MDLTCNINDAFHFFPHFAMYFAWVVYDSMHMMDAVLNQWPDCHLYCIRFNSMGWSRNGEGFHIKIVRLVIVGLPCRGYAHNLSLIFGGRYFASSDEAVASYY